jgi:RNA polymerase sigma factor (sigma-70 family)
MTGLDDRLREFRKLMCEVRAGSEDAAWRLVNGYGESLRRAIRRRLNERLRSKFDSIDFTQDVWKSFFRTIDHLDIDDPQQLVNYLLGMAQHKVDAENRRRLDLEQYNVNRERPLADLDEQDALQLASPEPGPAEIAIARERLDRILENMSVIGRRIVCLRLAGHSYESIAYEVQLSERTVYRILERVRRTMPI